MEDLKAYIESGVLELYVLGDLSQDERHEVELMLTKHPELKNELRQIEKALEVYADKHAVEPGQHLRQKFLDSVNPAKSKQSNPAARIVPMRQNNFYKYAFAASLALLLVSTFIIVNLNQRLSESRNRIALLETSNEKFSGRVNYIQTELNRTKLQLDVFQNPDFELVNLKGTPKAPSASVVVAFNSEKEIVMLDLASLKMPENDEEHQYQLWALVDSKPVDLGVFDSKADSTGMMQMKSVSGAQAFAVTLEPKGGSSSPTLELMMAMGKI